MRISMNLNTLPVLIALLSNVTASSSDQALVEVRQILFEMYSDNVATPLALDAGAYDIVEGLQEDIISSCQKISLKFADNKPSWTGSECILIAKDYARAGNEGAAVVEQVDQLGKAGSLPANVVLDITNDFSADETACGSAASALAQACPSQKNDILGDQSDIDGDIDTTDGDLPAPSEP